MPSADLVIHGTVLTVDDDRPTAEALAVTNGRLVAIGTRAGVEPLAGPDTLVLDIGEGCVMPGFVEAHGHPLTEAIMLSDRMVDIRPVTVRDPADRDRRRVFSARLADGLSRHGRRGRRHCSRRV